MKTSPVGVSVLRAAIVLLLLVPIAGCGAVTGLSEDAQDSGGDARVSGGEDVAMKEGTPEAAVGADANVAPSDGDISAGSAGGGLIALDTFGSKIVKSAELGVRAKDVRGVAEAAQRVAANNGGSVLQSQISGSDDAVSAYLTLSVPSEEFEGVLSELRGLGKEVVHDTVSGQDVTEEFVDLESRERNLLAAEESLLELYGRAETVEDTLTIERELTNIRGQIEQVQGRLEYLENRTAFSQISVSVEPVAGPKPEPAGWDPAAVAAKAWTASLTVLQGIANAAIVALVFGWWVLPLLIGGYLLWRRRRGAAPSPTEA